MVFLDRITKKRASEIGSYCELIVEIRSHGIFEIESHLIFEIGSSWNQTSAFLCMRRIVNCSCSEAAILATLKI